MENSSPFSLHVFANRCGGAVELEWGVAREEREKGKDGIFVAIEGSLVGSEGIGTKMEWDSA